MFAAELCAALGPELAAHPRMAARLVGELDDLAGLRSTALAREALRAPGVLTLGPAVAVEAQLGLLAAFAPLRDASLWTLAATGPATGRVCCVHHIGDSPPSRGMRALARALLAGETTETSARAELFGVCIERSHQPVAALVGRAAPRQRDRCRALMREALPTLGVVLERDAVLARNATSERALAQAGERRLTRLGFDLHDGPLQEIALLAEDLRLLREQLGHVLGDRAEAELMQGRLDDLHARLAALEMALRRISTSVHASVLADRPFATAVRELADGFASRTGIAPEITLDGDPTTLSPSQRIALLSVIQEALNNTREHSDASEVTIAVSVGATGVQARIADDGRGFDVEAALMRAARRGRIGLAGVHERVRLLGGQCQVASAPGGPTVISLVLPPWRPLAAAAGAESVAA
jgi:signal transduction histidine kinase